MMKVFALAALVGVTVAQPNSPELQTSRGNLAASLPINGDMTIDRTTRTSISLSEMADNVATLHSTVNGISSDMADNVVTGEMGRIAGTANAQILSMRDANRDMSTIVANLESTVMSQTVMISSRMSTNEAQQSTALRTGIVAIDAAAQERAASVDRTVESMQSAAQSTTVAVNSQMAALQASLSRSVASSVVAASAAATAWNTTLVRGMNSKMDSRSHHWLGGCSGHRNGGWNWVCLDRIESENSMPYFQKQNNDRFIARVAGLYRVVHFTINNSCNWAHSGLFVQGRWVQMTHIHVTYSWWKDTYNDAVFRAAANHYFGVRTHSACGHTGVYAFGSHGRIEAHYQGHWTA